MKLIRRHLWTILAALAVLAIYGATLSLLPRHVFWMPDEGAKFIELNSIYWAGDIRYTVPFPTTRIDPDFEFLPDRELFPRPSIAHDGSLYLGFDSSVLFPLGSRFLFQLFGLTGIYLMPLCSGWCVAILSGALTWRIAARWAPLAVLLVGLATPVWFYSMLFWEHTVACVFALLAVYTAAISPRWRLAAVLVVTAALTVAATLRLEMLPFAAAVFLGWGVSSLMARPLPNATATAFPQLPRSLPRWALPLVLVGLVAALLFVLNASLTLRHRMLLATLPMQMRNALVQFWNAPGGLVEVFVNSAYGEGPRLWDGLAPAVGIALLYCMVAAFVKSPYLEAGFILPGCVAVLGFSFSLLIRPDTYRALHGFFPIAPFLVVWPYALLQAWSERRHAELTLMNIALLELVLGFGAISTSYIWGGHLEVGMEWGQRYMLILYPLLTVAALAGLRGYWASNRPRWLRASLTAVVGVMMIVGVGLEVRGLRMLYTTRQQLSGWDQALRVEGPIITDVWWLPSGVAVFVTEREMFYVGNRIRIKRWAQLAAAQGVRHFTFASLTPVDASELGTPDVRRTAARLVDGLYLTSFALADGSTAGSPP